MAKSNVTSGKYTETKVKRGVGVMTPSDQDTPKDPLEEAIVGGIEKIFEELKLSESLNEIKGIVKSGFDGVSKTTDLLASINDKMVALLGAVYGYKGMSDSIKSATLISRLGTIDAKSTPFGGLVDYLTVITDSIKANTPVDQSSLFNELALAISSVMGEVKESIDKLAMNSISGEQFAKLSEQLNGFKESILANPTSGNIARIADDFSNLTDIVNTLVTELKANATQQLVNTISNEVKNISSQLTSTVSNEEIVNSIKTVTNSVSNITNSVNNLVTENTTNINNVTNELSELVQNIQTVNSNTEITDYTSYLNDIVNKLTELQTTVVSIPAPVVENNSTINNTEISNSISNVISEISNVSNSINNAANTAVNNIDNSVSEITNSVQSVISSISTYTEQNNTAISNVANELNTMVSTLTELKPTENTVFDYNNILTSIADKIDLLKGVTENTISNITTNNSSLIDSSVVNNYSEVVNSINSVSEAINTVSTVMNSLQQNTVNEITNSVQSIVSNISSVTEQNNTAISNVANELNTMISTLTELKPTENTAVDYNNILSEIANKLDGLKTATENVVNNITTNNTAVDSSVVNTYNEIVNSINNVSENIETTISQITSSVQTIGDTVSNSVTNSISEITNSVQSIVSNISSVTEQNNTAISNVANELNTMVSTLTELKPTENTAVDYNNILSEIANKLDGLKTATETNIQNISSINSVAETINKSLVNSIGEFKKTVIDTISPLSELSTKFDAIDTISDTLDEIRDAINAGTDTVDLSNIELSLNKIHTALAVASNGYDDSNVITAINELTKKITDFAEISETNSASYIYEINKNILKTISEIADLKNWTIKNHAGLTNNNDIKGIEDIVPIETDYISEIRSILNDIKNNLVSEATVDLSSVTTALDEIKNIVPEVYNDSNLIASVNTITQAIREIKLPEINVVNDSANPYIEYNITGSVDITGISSDTIEKLASLANIKFDSKIVDSIRNIGTVITSLNDASVPELDPKLAENIQSISASLAGFNGIDKRTGKNIAGLFESLNKIKFSNKLDPSVLKPFSDTIKVLVDTFDSTKVGNDKEISAKQKSVSMLVSGVSNIMSSMESLSKIKKPADTSKVMGSIADFVNSVKDIKPVGDKEKSAIGEIGNIIKAVLDISGFDDAKFKALSTNLRKMTKMTATPGMLTGLGLSSTGLIYSFIQSLAELSNAAKGSPDNVKTLTKMIDTVCGIGDKFDADAIENIKDNMELLLEITSQGTDRSLFTLNTNLATLGDEIKNNKNSISEIETLEDIVTSILKINDAVDFGEVAKLTSKMVLLDVSVNAVKYFINTLGGINTGKTLQKINDITSIVDELANEIDLDDLDKINEFAIKSFDVSVALTKNIVFGKIAQLGASMLVSEFESLAEAIKSMPVITKENEDTAKRLITFGDSLTSISKGLAIAGMLAIPAFIGAKSLYTEFVILETVIDKFKSIDLKENEIKDKTKTICLFVAASSLIMILGALAALAIDFVAVLEFTFELTIFMVAMAGVMWLIQKVAGGADKTVKDLDKMAILIATCAATMILGGLITMAYPQIFIGAMLFAVELGVFMLAVLGAINLGTKGMKETQANAAKFVEMIAVCGAVLIVGALFNQIPGLFVSALCFAVELGVFMLAVLGAINIGTQGIGDAMKDAEKFAILVGVSGVLLLLAGLIVGPSEFFSALFFAIELAAFMLAVTYAYKFAADGIGDSMKYAAQFAILVGVSGLVLLLASKIIGPSEFFSALFFAIELAAFMLAVTFAYKFASKGIKDSLKDAKKLAILIGISAITLLIGGAFMLIPGMPLAVLEFALILGIFIVAVVGIFGLVGKKIEKSMPAAIGLAILVGITSAALLTAGYMMIKNPGMDTAIWSFVGATLVTVLGMSLAIWGLSKISASDLAKGEIALAGIAGIIWLMGKAFDAVADAAIKMNQVNDLEGNLKTMGVVMLAVGGAVAAVALLSAIPGVAVALAIGEGLLAGICGIVFLMGKAVSAVAKSMMDLDKVKDFKSEQIIGALEEYVKIIPALEPLASIKLLAKLKIATSGCNSISNAIYTIAKSVKAMADLETIAYDANGKEIGKRKLNSDDFSLAANNISEIITVLGGSIIGVYEQNPDMFTTGNSLTDLLGMDTPYARVVKSCTTLGNMISLIAEGVKDYANMTAPIYDANGKLVGRRTLDKNDFKNAADNIKIVISTLGGAIMSLYNGKVVDASGTTVGYGKDMFGWKLIGDNPFATVVKSCTMLGTMINDIAKGVQTYSKLPDGINFQTVSDNIKTVISCLGGAIMSIYRDPKFADMFTDASMWHTDADKTPFGMVVKSLSGVGKIIKEAVEGIQAADKLDLPSGFAKEGSPLQEKLKGIISCTAQGIMAAYHSNPEWFEDDSWFHNNAADTPFGMVKACLGGTSKIVIEAADAIKKIMDLGVTDTEGTKKLVAAMIAAIPEGIMNVALNDKYKEYFEDEDGELFENIKNSFKKFDSVMDVVTGGYKKASKLGFTIEEGKENSVSTISQIIGKMIYNLPYYIFTEYKKHPEFYSEDGLKNLESIEKAFDKYEDIVDSITDTYDSIFKSLNKIGALQDTAPINGMNTSLQAMLDGAAKVLSVNTEGLLTTEAVSSFAEKVNTYVDSLLKISDVYNKVPTDQVRLNGIAQAIQNMNAEIVKIPDQTIFKDETNTVSGLVRTINSVNVGKADKINKLVDSLNSLGAKFNGLDKFTEVLAGQMSDVLSKLTKSINDSAGIIKKADAIQARRKAHIESLIGQVKGVLSSGLDITINDGAAQQTATGGATGSPNISGSSSMSTTTVNQTTNNAAATGGAGGGAINYTQLQKVITNAIAQAKGGYKNPTK